MSDISLIGWAIILAVVASGVFLFLLIRRGEQKRRRDKEHINRFLLDQERSCYPEKGGRP